MSICLELQKIDKLSTLSFEGVCVTAVILAPGACGMGGPTRGSCHHFAGSRGSGGSREIRNEFQIVRKPHICTVKASPRPPPNHPGPSPAQRRLWEVLGELGEGLEELWESSGRLWESQWEGLAELWESFGRLYIEKLPINRTSGRYVIPTASLLTLCGVLVSSWCAAWWVDDDDIVGAWPLTCAGSQHGSIDSGKCWWDIDLCSNFGL